MVLGKIISQVVGAGTPVDGKFTVVGTVLYPIKAHVNGFGPALFYCFVGNSAGALVVGLDGCGMLGMAEFSESGAQRGGLFCIKKKCSDLRFSR